MKNDLNNITITGNLVSDPELRHTPKGKPVCNFSIASNQTHKKDDGTVSESTVYVDVSAWGEVGETVKHYKAKGDPVAITGRLSMDKWNDRISGDPRSKLKIKAHEVIFLPRHVAKDSEED